MENIQQSIENLVEFISQTVSLNRRLQKKKVDASLVKLAFTQADKKRKGFLDLANVYQLCGEVSEDELFVVFKWLDSSKTGDVSYEDFQQALAGPQSVNDKKQDCNAVNSVKQVITTYLQNWDYSQGSQRKLGINEEFLTKIYHSICQTQRKSSLTVEDLVSVFSQSKKCDSLCKEHIRNMFRQVNTINEKSFLEAFQTIKQAKPTQMTQMIPKSARIQQNIKLVEPEYQEEQLLDGINNEYMAQRNTPKLNHQKLQEVNNFIHQRYPKHLCERQSRYATELKRQEPQEEESSDAKSGDITQLLSNIQKRREQLQKGSLQRKKLIEEALSRKKSNITPTGTPTLNESETYSPRNLSRTASTPKTSVHSSSYVNNFVDVNKNDFSKMFSKYREEKDNFSNLETRLKEKRFDEDLSTRGYERTEVKTPKYMERTASSFQQSDLTRQLATTMEWRNDTFRPSDNFAVDTPKFSQTAKEKFYERPASTTKVDRISQIREKINHLPQRNGQSNQHQNRQIDIIIEKYRNFKPESTQCSKNEVERNGFSSYLMNQTSSFRGVDNTNSFTQQRRAPDSYIEEQKHRPVGVIHQYRSPSGSIQKENLLKRAEQEAARKILEIERKAKLKVLERKSAAGLKWVK